MDSDGILLTGFCLVLAVVVWLVAMEAWRHWSD